MLVPSLVNILGPAVLLDLHPKAKTFLDLGCGEGSVARFMAFHGLEVLAIDKQYDFPPRLKREPGVRYQQADLHGWKPEGSWDIMALLNVIQFLDKGYVLGDFLPRLAACLSPGGLIEVLTFAPTETFEARSKYAPEEIKKSFPTLHILEHRVLEYEGLAQCGGEHHFHLTLVRARKGA